MLAINIHMDLLSYINPESPNTVFPTGNCTHVASDITGDLTAGMKQPGDRI